MMLVFAAVAFGAPTAQELRAAWEVHRPLMDASAVHPLSFTDDEWAKVAEGKVAKRREHLDGADRVVGLRWIDAPFAHTWVSVQDPHGSMVPGMVHEDLPGSTPNRRLLYQRIDLPWPLAARQWVIAVENNVELAQATRGAVWERTWALSPERGATLEDPKAVWTPVNDGGWMYVDAPGGTLVAYHVRSVVGGNVPDDVATRWAFGTLHGLLDGIQDRVPWVKAHYDASHPPIRHPEGSVVAPFAP